MIVFRLSKAKYARDLSGKGAEKAGGRWNSKGTPMVYTSASRALCTAEIAVHTPLGILPNDYHLITLQIPDHSIWVFPDTDLPDDWKLFPHPDTTQKMGDLFIRSQAYLTMRVPSVVVQGDYNFLVNPDHSDFDQVKVLEIEPFSFDKRLFG